MTQKTTLFIFLFVSSCAQSLFTMDYTQETLLQYLTSLPDTPDKITLHCQAINLCKPPLFPFAKDYDFGNINHLNLQVNGDFSLHYALKAPTFSLKVRGLLTLGKSNEEMGILAATHGPLKVIADSIDAQFGKMYGKEKTLIESIIGNITIGAPTRGVDGEIQEQYVERNYPWQCKKNGLRAQFGLPPEPVNLGFDCTINQLNAAYAASDNILTLKSATNIFIQYGSVLSTLKNHLIAMKEIQNLSGKISSHGSTKIEADIYNHIREGAVNKPRNRDHAQYPGSGPALLESLKKVSFLIKTKIYNLAGSIRSSKNLSINGSPLQGSPQYIEEVQNFYTHGNYNVNGDPGQWAYQYHLMFTQSCTTQAGNAISMNLGDFTITGNMSAGTIAVTGNTGSFINTELERSTIIPTHPKLVNVTEYAQQEAQKPGIYQLAGDGSVHTEFPFGAPLKIDQNKRVLLGNNQAIPLDWENIFNPLSGINFDLFLQRLISAHTGKIYKTHGNSISSILSENAHQWKQHNQKEIMSPDDVEQTNQSMLLTQITDTDNVQQQETLLLIAPQDVNPYQSPGDYVADEFSCITQHDQTHKNNRIVATKKEGITLQSTAGNITLETQSYTRSYDIENGKVTEQIAMPQQQLIAPTGPVNIKADKNIARTGTLIAAATNVKEQADHGSVTKNPLVLQKRVETVHTKKGFWSSSTRMETAITHSALSCETHAGGILHDKAGIAIQAVAPRDTASEIIYESPKTTIEGLLLANSFTSSEQKSGMFTDETRTSSKQTPFAIAAHIQAPTVRFLGNDARVNANIYATELHDGTAKGIQFVAKVAQMLCSGQTLISSPLAEIDSGFEAGYEVMIPPMLMVEKIIRLKNDGCMLFESAIMDKNRTEIIGNFVETTYHLKQWQRNWHNLSQVISDEALVVIAFAITLYTQGMGVELLQPLLNNVTATTGMQLSAAGIAAVNAGISAICSSTATSILKTGDPLHTAKHLTSPAHLKSLSFTMASAGLCTQLSGMLDINMEPGIKTFSEHMQQQALQGTVDTLLNAALTTSSEKSLSKTVQQIPLKAIAAYASNQICTAFTHEMNKQVGQTLVGGLSGFAQEQTRKGFVSGMTGALTAETVGALLIADSQAIASSAIAQLNKKGIQKTPENIQKAIAQQVQERLKLAKIAAASVAVITRQNPTIAAGAATNAIDNDIAIRGQLAAFAEYKSLLAATSQAYATLQIHQEKPQPRSSVKHVEKQKKQIRTRPNKVDNAAHDLALYLIEKSARPNSYTNFILEHAKNSKHIQQKRSLYDRIVHPKTPRLIAQTAPIIRIAFINALNKTLDTFAMIPNPLGIACFATGTGRDLYNGVTTPGEIVYNTALTFGILKGIQLTGKGIKILYQKGKGTIKNITDKVIDRVYQYRYASQGRVPFLQNPRAGKWTNADASIVENDLMLTNSIHYEFARARWHKNQAAPFNVVGHGSPNSIRVDVPAIHPKGLSQNNLFLLRENGYTSLNAAQLARLIRTAPGYQQGQHINLFSCKCGAEINGIAKQLATLMKVPVSAFSENVALQSNGLGFYTMGSGINNYGVMKTFYPQTHMPYHLIALSLMPAFLLTGDTAQQQENVSTETFDRLITNIPKLYFFE